MIRSRFALILIFALVTNSVASFADDDEQKLIVGTWGGPGISLFLTPSGGDGDFHCSFGRVSQPVMANETGEFSSQGYLDFYEGGAKPPTRVAAIFAGVVVKKQMRLRATLANGLVWDFVLSKGSLGETKKCWH